MRKNVVLEKSLREMGQGLKIARLRRRLPLAVIAERAGISVITLRKIEKGMTGVAVGNVAAVFWALGLGTPLPDAAVPQKDELAFQLDAQRLPKRGRSRKKP